MRSLSCGMKPVQPLAGQLGRTHSVTGGELSPDPRYGRGTKDDTEVGREGYETGNAFP